MCGSFEERWTYDLQLKKALNGAVVATIGPLPWENKYETTVWDSTNQAHVDLFTKRYATKEEARAGHKATIENVGRWIERGNE